MRKEWLASLGQDKELFKVSEAGNAIEYLTRDKPDGDPNGRIPVFLVWRGDSIMYFGASQMKADAAFAKAAGGNRA